MRSGQDVRRKGVERDNVLPIHGAVRKKTQRVCWTVGNDRSTVYDTGLYHVTKNESSILVPTGPKQTRQELLVRRKQSPHNPAMVP